MWADILYACDGDWWDEHIYEVLSRFKGELWTQDLPAAEKFGLNRIEGSSQKGLGKEKINFGANGGYQMVNLAYLFGAQKIILLGFDMKLGKDKKSHWHGDHPRYLNKVMPISKWIDNFNRLASDLKSEGVNVINATRDSALECFQKQKLEVVLCSN